MFYSPKFSLAGLDNPTLSFWMYHTSTPGDETMEVLVAPASDSFETTGSVISRLSEQTGWVRHSVSLAQYAETEWVRIAFRGTGAGVEDVYIDNVSIGSRHRFDVAVTALRVPARTAAGVPVKTSVTLTNTGTDALSDIKVTLSSATGTLTCSMASWSAALVAGSQRVAP